MPRTSEAARSRDRMLLRTVSGRRCAIKAPSTRCLPRSTTISTSYRSPLTRRRRPPCRSRDSTSRSPRAVSDRPPRLEPGLDGRFLHRVESRGMPMSTSSLNALCVPATPTFTPQLPSRTSSRCCAGDGAWRERGRDRVDRAEDASPAACFSPPVRTSTELPSPWRESAAQARSLRAVDDQGMRRAPSCGVGCSQRTPVSLIDRTALAGLGQNRFRPLRALSDAAGASPGLVHQLKGRRRARRPRAHAMRTASPRRLVPPVST